MNDIRVMHGNCTTPVVTDHDPLGDDEPESALTLATSVQQRLAFGARAGQQVRRMDSGCGVVISSSG